MKTPPMLLKYEQTLPPSPPKISLPLLPYKLPTHTNTLEHPPLHIANPAQPVSTFLLCTYQHISQVHLEPLGVFASPIGASYAVFLKLFLSVWHFANLPAFGFSVFSIHQDNNSTLSHTANRSICPQPTNITPRVLGLLADQHRGCAFNSHNLLRNRTSFFDPTQSPCRRLPGRATRAGRSAPRRTPTLPRGVFRLTCSLPMSSARTCARRTPASRLVRLVGSSVRGGRPSVRSSVHHMRLRPPPTRSGTRTKSKHTT
ncbi:hypothetical protein VTJ04DRAFT_3056 [Mycothermus thermophilus]|uniref:uncharacterized protein n=1 Tax=Humicola insolens TaxID=85995 RepID=UPI003742DAB9